MSMYMMNVHEHVACSSPCCMFKSKEHGRGHAAWAWTCSTDMDIIMDMDLNRAAVNLLGADVFTMPC
jgi:hypothetical protein